MDSGAPLDSYMRVGAISDTMTGGIGDRHDTQPPLPGEAGYDDSIYPRNDPPLTRPTRRRLAHARIPYGGLAHVPSHRRRYVIMFCLVPRSVIGRRHAGRRCARRIVDTVRFLRGMMRLARLRAMSGRALAAEICLPRSRAADERRAAAPSWRAWERAHVILTDAPPS